MRSHPPSTGRTWSSRLGYVLSALALLVCGAALFLWSPPGRAWLRREVRAELERSLRCGAELDEASLDGHQLVLRGLKLHDREHRLLAEVAELRLRVEDAEPFHGLIALEGVAVRPRLYLDAGERWLRSLHQNESGRSGRGPTGLLGRAISWLSVRPLHVSVEGGSVADVNGLSGDVSGAWSGPERSFQVNAKLQAPGAALEASVRRAEEAVSIDLGRLLLEPRLFSRVPLRVPVQLSGTAELRGDTVSAQLEAEAGRARASLRGTVDLRRRWSEGFAFSASGVDLSELLPDRPRTNLGLTASGKGGGPTLDALQGEIALAMPASKVRGETMGPVQISARVDHGELHLPRLVAELPGVSMSASGGGTVERLSLRGKLLASDLSALSRTLGGLRERRFPSLDGQGTLRFALEGPLRHPRVSLNGDFPRLQLQGQSFQDLSFDAWTADAARPLNAEAKLGASRIQVGGIDLGGVSAEVAIAGPMVRADARADEWVAHLGGDRAPDSRSLTVRELSLRSPESTWTLQEPARVTAGAGVVAEPFHLKAGAQEVTVAGRVSGEQVDATLEVRQLDLPRRQAGLLSADVTVQGTLSDPVAKGDAQLTSGLVELTTHFEVPVLGLVHRSNEPIHVTVLMGEQSIRPLLDAAGDTSRLMGTASGQLTVGGTAGDPSAQLVMTAQYLNAPGYPALLRQRPTVTVTVTADQRQEVQAAVEVTTPDGDTGGTIRVRTPFTLSRLLDHLPDREALLAAPYFAEARFNRVPLEVQGGRTGDLSGRATLDGSLLDPKLEAHLLGGVQRRDEDSRPNLPAVESAASRARRSNLALSEIAAREIEKWLATLRASAGTGAGGPSATPAVAPCLPADPPSKSPASADPAFVRGEIDFKYQHRSSTLTADLASSGGGQAKVVANLEVDLSLPALLRGVDPSQVTLDAVVQARDLDLAVLRGSLSRVKEIGGQLSASARLAGALDAPRAYGCVGLKKGVLGIDGYGAYQGVEVRADADGDTLRISQLQVQSGKKGKAVLNAEVKRAGGKLSVKGEAYADALPVTWNFQPHAEVTTQLRFQGEISAKSVNLHRIELTKTLVKLPDDQLRELHGMELRSDILLTRDGVRDVPPQALPEPQARQYSFTLVAPEPITVEGPRVANMKVGLSDGFRLDYAGHLDITGKVTVREPQAQIVVLTRPFQVQVDSQLAFTGSPTNPQVTLVAAYTNLLEDVTVTMTAVDRWQDLSPKLSSDQGLSQYEILELLLTGRRAFKPGAGASMGSSDVTSIIGSLLGNKLRSLLARYVLVDGISISSGGGDDPRDVQIEAYWFIKDVLRASFNYRPGADARKGKNTYEIQAECLIWHNLVFRTLFGDANAAGADLVASWDY